jgi:hypothetical protein
VGVPIKIVEQRLISSGDFVRVADALDVFYGGKGVAGSKKRLNLFNFVNHFFLLA